MVGVVLKRILAHIALILVVLRLTWRLEDVHRRICDVSENVRLRLRWPLGIN